MRITAQEEYGIRCLLRLARSEQPMTIPQLAASEGLTASYVGNLVALLRVGGIVKCQRGRRGGCQLAEPPDQITLADVIPVLGQPLFDESAFCERYAGTETNGVCVHYDACSIRSVWNALETLTHAILKRITLSDLLRNERETGHFVREQMVRAAEEMMPPVVNLASPRAERF